MRDHNILLTRSLKIYPKTVGILWQAQRRGKRIILPDQVVKAHGSGNHSMRKIDDIHMAIITRRRFETFGNTIPLDEDPGIRPQVRYEGIGPDTDPVLEAKIFRLTDNTGRSIESFWDFRQETPTRFYSESLGVL